MIREKYYLWSLKMSNLFKSQELWELVKNGFPDPKPAEPDQALRDNRKKDAKALFFIQSGLDDDIFSHIASVNTSNQAWEILKQEFLGNRKVITVKLQTLHREFEMLKMKDEESVQDYLSRVSAIMNQMKSYGENVTDEVIVSKVLRSLSSNFDHLVAAIEEFKDLSVYTFDELMSSLLAHEDRIGSLGPSDFWFIDNGSSSHMSRSGSLFVNLDISKKLMVRLGDDIQVQVEGKVSIDIDMTTAPTLWSLAFEWPEIIEEQRHGYGRMSWVHFLKCKSDAFETFKRFKALVEKQNNKQEEGELMQYSIKVGPYERKLHPDPDKLNDETTKILEPISKMSESNRKQYVADEKIIRLMYGSEKTEQRIRSRLVDEFDKFVSVEGESLSFVYERLTTLVNIMDRNGICPSLITINTKFLNSLQPEWSKYVIMTRQNANIDTTTYDQLFDTLTQHEPHVLSKRANQTARNHDPLALVARSHVHNLQSYASSSYSYSPQPYYVTHPSSVIDHEEDYQGEIQGDAQEDKLTTVMMNARRQNINQVATTGNKMVQQMEVNDEAIQRAPQTESNPRKTNVQCYNCNARGHYARDSPQPRVRDAKYFREQMLLEMKDEVGGNLNEEENDFALNNHYGDDSLEELNATVILMARIQPTDENSDAKPTYDADALSEVNVSKTHINSQMPLKSVHEHTNHAKFKTIINIYDDDQIDSSIIFDDPYVEDNGGEDKHDLHDHDQYIALQSLINNVQNERSLNNKLKKQQELLQKELEAYKERVKTLEKQLVKATKYKKAYEELERELLVEKNKIDKLIKEKDKIHDDFVQLEYATVGI
ncbi:integrase, catalytic region, zinc finger, CCHC-type containing protein [Tanacetum coccineum]